ncbi:M28 family peptidase [Novosphingobium sp. B 225]|uniref:M28 family peptidase n=1 Tax=Novosphingobium sp. B 225 TaxID=1961849 RepID=UPI000B4B68C9|nr:M28 family peptidase [Novosphingobium sp. B 225]
MRNLLRTAACSALVLASAVSAQEPQTVSWEILADLTTEIGPRLPGSPREAAARDWAVVRLKALGLANVRSEAFTIPGWVRGVEVAQLTAPYPHKLHITALGNSAPTPAAGISGELIYFQSLAALQAAPDSAVKGKIAFIDHAMKANQDGSGYGPSGQARRQGPSVASAKGAVAVVIRSIGTDHNRDPHTGVTNFDRGAAAIPAGAVSAPDADLIARVAAKGKPMTVALTLTGRPQAGLPSGNVVAEVPGRDPTLPAILIGCHLDSWDLGTGAIDDASGCAIITDAALRLKAQGQPLRTVRLLWAGSEELGGFGGDAFAAAHANVPHALAMESDFGADRVWRVGFRLSEANKPLADKVAAALAPLGIVRGANRANGGTDVEPMIERQKLSVIDLDQDGSRYFDLHHTPDDTLDKVDPVQLEQNVQAWLAVLGIVANEAGPISPN